MGSAPSFRYTLIESNVDWRENNKMIQSDEEFPVVSLPAAKSSECLASDWVGIYSLPVRSLSSL